MPLWSKPKSKVSLDDVRELMANHFKGTELDSRKYIASGIFEAPYRPRPQTWGYKGECYVNERTIAIKKTGFNFIEQISLSMPIELSAVLSFAVDDSSTTPRFPVYSSSTRFSTHYYGVSLQDEVRQPLKHLTRPKHSGFKTLVSNFVYYHYKDAYPVLKRELDYVQKVFTIKLALMDEEALSLYKNGDIEEAIRKVTDFGVHAGDTMHAHWLHFYGILFVRLHDYVIMSHKEDNAGCGCTTIYSPYDDEWKERIVAESVSR